MWFISNYVFLQLLSSTLRPHFDIETPAIMNRAHSHKIHMKHTTHEGHTRRTHTNHTRYILTFEMPTNPYESLSIFMVCQSTQSFPNHRRRTGPERANQVKSIKHSNFNISCPVLTISGISGHQRWCSLRK